MIRTAEFLYCYVCGEKGGLLYTDLEDGLFGVSGKWNLRQCPKPKCGLIWLDPMPVTEELSKLYENYYTHSAGTNSKVFNWLYTRVRDGILNSRLGYKTAGTFWKFLGSLLSFIPDVYDRLAGEVMWLKPLPQGRLLDIGCGSGKFLALMQNLDWRIQGIDPDAEAVHVARNIYGLTVEQGTLPEVNFSGQTFDAVTMNHVIEHTPDPYTILREINRILKFGGKLILTTTNAQGWGHRHFRQDWIGLDIPRHLYIYSPPTLKILVERAGLTVTELRTTGRGAMYFLGMSHLIRKSRNRSQVSPHATLLSQAKKKIFTLLVYQAWESLVAGRDYTGGEEIILKAEKRS